MNLKFGLEADSGSVAGLVLTWLPPDMTFTTRQPAPLSRVCIYGSNLQAAINYAVPMPLQTKDGLYLQWLDKALKESFARFQARCRACYHQYCNVSFGCDGQPPDKSLRAHTIDCRQTWLLIPPR